MMLFYGGRKWEEDFLFEEEWKEWKKLSQHELSACTSPFLERHRPRKSMFSICSSNKPQS